jgi:lactoylglutathione lyase
MPAFAYTVLYVHDVAAQIKFYSAAFGLEMAFITDDNTYGELATGGTKLGIANHSMGTDNFTEPYRKSSRDDQPFGIEIAFSTDDVDATVEAALAAGATLFAPAKAKPWGQTVAYVRDPEGFLVEICTPMN